MRTPEERRGDLSAQLAANLRGAVRVQEIAQKYGVDVVLGMMTGVQDYSERMIRAQLERLDNGEYSFEDFCDGDGILSFGQTEDEPIWVRLRVKKHGDSMTIDFAGSDDQVEGPMNAPLAVTASGVYTAVKMIIDPNDIIPANSGTWRAIDVLAPEGSVVNVLPPAPVVYANHEMTHRIADMVFGAVAQGYPERALACSQGTSAILTLGGQDPRTGQRYVSYETLGGGMGARPNQDGINAVKAGISNTMNTPVEELEMRFPVQVDKYEIVADSGGAGQYRGGCGVRRVWRVVGHTATATICCERTKSPPFGLLGGHAGAPTSVHVVDPQGNRDTRNSKGPAFPVPDGYSIAYDVAGSGGYGNPTNRDPASIHKDIINGYVSPDQAQEEYGVDASGMVCEYCGGMTSAP